MPLDGSAIDPTKPTTGLALTPDVRANFAAAKAEIEALQAAIIALQNPQGSPFLLLTGGTLTGPLILAADPLVPQGATTKHYVDTRIASGVIGLPYLPITGGTLTGTLTLANDPLSAMQPTTKQYVDAGLASATAGAVPVAGGTMTGPLILSGDPTAALGAATRQYVDTGLAPKAPIASPIFTGLPQSVTGLPDDHTLLIATTAFVIGQASAVLPLLSGAASIGTSLRYARADHVHPSDTSVLGGALPLMDGVAAVGSAVTASRQDHVHPIDTSRYSASNPSNFQTDAQVAASLTALQGTANPLMNGTVAVGTATLYSRQDHVHPSDTSRYSATNPAGFQTAAQVSASIAAAPFLPIGGGTLTGLLTLSGPPTAALHAATKAYADLMLPLTGGTVTGATTFSGTLAAQGTTTVGTNTTAASFIVNGPAGAQRIMQWSTAGLARWRTLANSTAEPGGGANTGSDLDTFAFLDTGGVLGAVERKYRNNGNITWNPNNTFTDPTYTFAQGTVVVGKTIYQYGPRTYTSGVAAAPGGLNPLGMYQNITLSGTLDTGSGTANYNNFILADTLQVSAAMGSYSHWSMSHSYNAGATRGRVMFELGLHKNVASAVVGEDLSFYPLVATMSFDAGESSDPLNPLSAARAANFDCRIGGTGNSVRAILCQENDIRVFAGNWVRTKINLGVHWGVGDAVHGSYEDCGIAFNGANDIVPGTGGTKTLLQIGGFATSLPWDPLLAETSIMQMVGPTVGNQYPFDTTVTYGLDLRGLNFRNSVLRSQGILIDGLGQIPVLGPGAITYSAAGIQIGVPNYYTTAISIAVPGIGYRLNDLTTDTMGNLVQITGVDAGGRTPTAVALVKTGYAATPPTNPVATTFGTGTGLTLNLTTSLTSRQLSLGTTGDVVLVNADPMVPLGVATKRYADLMVPLAGGTMTGILTLSGPPTVGLHAATKAYVDALASSTTPLMDGTAAAGVATALSRADHVHPTDTTRFPTTGGTLTGALVISNGGNSNLVLNNTLGGAGSRGIIQFQNNSLNRWQFVCLGSTESGGNVGSDFQLIRFDDTGTQIDAMLTVVRSTGVVTIGGTTVSRLIITPGVSGSTQVNLSGAGTAGIGVTGTLAVTGALTVSATITGNTIQSTGAGTSAFAGPITSAAGGSSFINVNATNVTASNGLNGVSCTLTGTMTAVNTTLTAATGNQFFTFNTVQATGSGIQRWQRGGLDRWRWFCNTAAESGSNVGSDMSLQRFDDTGTVMSGLALAVFRSTGLVSLVGDPTANLGAATKQYVDTKVSDERVKEVISPYTHGLAELVSLNPVNFKYVQTFTYGEPYDGADQAPLIEGEHVGLIAQAVQAVLPELVTQGMGTINGQPVEDMRSISNNALFYAIINALKEVSARLTTLEGKAA